MNLSQFVTEVKAQAYQAQLDLYDLEKTGVGFEYKQIGPKKIKINSVPLNLDLETYIREECLRNNVQKLKIVVNKQNGSSATKQYERYIDMPPADEMAKIALKHLTNQNHNNMNGEAQETSENGLTQIISVDPQQAIIDRELDKCDTLLRFYVHGLRKELKELQSLKEKYPLLEAECKRLEDEIKKANNEIENTGLNGILKKANENELVKDIWGEAKDWLKLLKQEKIKGSLNSESSGVNGVSTGDENKDQTVNAVIKSIAANANKFGYDRWEQMSVIFDKILRSNDQVVEQFYNSIIE